MPDHLSPLGSKAEIGDLGTKQRFTIDDCDSAAPNAETDQGVKCQEIGVMLTANTYRLQIG